jgi:hypothetical protein
MKPVCTCCCRRDVRKASVLPVSYTFAWLDTGRVRLCSIFGEAVQVRDLRLFNGRSSMCAFLANVRWFDCTQVRIVSEVLSA